MAENPEGEFLEFGGGLKPAASDEALRQTYLGMAHIAGTGPAGATCRQCVFWRARRRVKDKETGNAFWRTVPHRYRPLSAEIEPNGLAKHRCMKPVLNKAKRRFPHHASACRLFEPNHHPPVPVRIGKPKEDLNDDIED